MDSKPLNSNQEHKVFIMKETGKHERFLTIKTKINMRLLRARFV